MVLLQGVVFGRALMEAINRRGTRQAVASVARLSSAPLPRRNHRKREKRQGEVNPFERDECVQRLGGTSVRWLSTRREPTMDELLKDETWVAVYRFPGIQYGVLLAKAKLLQTVASVLLIPYTYYQYLNDTASLQFFGGVAVLGVVATSMLMLCTRYFNRMIGVISMTESNQFVRIGYLSFWGARRNKVVELEDTLLLSEANDNLSDAVVKFRHYSSDKYFYLPTSGVELLDEDRAKMLFGDVSVFNRSKKKD